MSTVFDIEGDGLLYDVTKIHCICCKVLKTQEALQFGPDRIHEGLEFLSSRPRIISHNICGFDIPAIKKLHPSFTYNELRDTLCMSKLFNPERSDGHALESYGKQFKRYKPVHEDWSVFSPEMLFRCMEDVEINVMTYQYLVEKYCTNWKWLKSLEIEQEFSLYHAAQELEGVDIDVPLARELIVKLDDEIAWLDKQLYERIPLRVKGSGNLEVGTMPFKKAGSYTKATIEWFGL